MIFTFKRFSLLVCLIDNCSVSHACNNVSAASGETPALYARGGCGPRPLRTREGPLGQTPTHASHGSDVFFERVWVPRTCQTLSGTTSHQQVDQSDQRVLEWRFFSGALLVWGELVVNPYPHQRLVFFRMGQRDPPFNGGFVANFFWPIWSFNLRQGHLKAQRPSRASSQERPRQATLLLLLAQIPDQSFSERATFAL